MHYTDISFVLPTPRMSESCAVRSDGTLKDASEIEWFNDPDDALPIQPPAQGSRPVASGTLDAFVQKDLSTRSGRVIRPTEKIRATNTNIPAKRPPPAPLNEPTPKRIIAGACHQVNDDDGDVSTVLEDLSDDEEDGDKEDAYERTKKLGDEDRDHRRGLKKHERSADLTTVFTQEKGRMNPVTNEREDGWWCEICKYVSILLTDHHNG